MLERSYTHAMQQLLNTPLLMDEAKAAMLVAAVRSNFNITALVTLEGGRDVELGAAEMDRLAATGRASVAAKAGPEKIYRVVDGMAIIPVQGTIMRTWGLHPFSGATGIDGLKAKLLTALDDNDVEGIMFDIHSNGGQVAGLFDFADMVHASNARNGGKPIFAIANEAAYSAAFGIFSAADFGYLPRTAGVGSVGVIAVHAEESKRLESGGIKATVIRAGEQKARVNSIEPLTDDAKERLQAEIDGIREIFIETVARNRRIAASRVRKTEALTYTGTLAVEIGFADAVMSYEQAFMDAQRRMRRKRAA